MDFPCCPSDARYLASMSGLLWSMAALRLARHDYARLQVCGGTPAEYSAVADRLASIADSLEGELHALVDQLVAEHHPGLHVASVWYSWGGI